MWICTNLRFTMGIKFSYLHILIKTYVICVHICFYACLQCLNSKFFSVEYSWNDIHVWRVLIWFSNLVVEKFWAFCNLFLTTCYIILVSFIYVDKLLLCHLYHFLCYYLDIKLSSLFRCIRKIKCSSFSFGFSIFLYFPVLS